MNFFWITFSFLLFNLSVLPCGDNLDCNELKKTEKSIDNDHKNHNQDSEHCPPFCTCACCGIFVFNSENIFFSFYKNNISNFKEIQFIIYKSFIKGNFFASIWQPPKCSV